MMATIDPSTKNIENTLNTLRYADRVRSLRRTDHSENDICQSENDIRKSNMLESPRSEDTIKSQLKDTLRRLEELVNGSVDGGLLVALHDELSAILEAASQASS